jgi:phage-related protein
VARALFRATQDRLQRLVDDLYWGSDADPSDIRTLRAVGAEWTVAHNSNGASFVFARLHWSDGAVCTFNWRVPYGKGVYRGTGEGSVPRTRYVSLDKWVTSRTLKGARAGSVATGGEPNRTRPRSRPEVGRGHAARKKRQS